MKNKFSSVDIAALLPELNGKLKGLRVNQVYDVDHRTYLIRFNTTTSNDENDIESGCKIILLLESGARFHTTSFQWPKSMTPSGFTMKLRKHLKNKRLEYIRQLGADRIVDLQFGTGEAAYHVVIELYDRGNIVITDFEWKILNILRPRTESGQDSDVRFAVREKYPKHLVRTQSDYCIPSRADIIETLSAAKAGDNLRKVFVPKVMFGPALLEHCFIELGMGENAKIRGLDPESGPDLILTALTNAQKLFNQISTNDVNVGIVTLTEERKWMKGFDLKNPDSEQEIVETDFRDFHPFLFAQFRDLSEVRESTTASENSKQILLKKFESFDESLDYFFSSVKGQKLESRQKHLEKEALMKLERVRIDHEKRLEELAAAQRKDEQKADLIIANSDLIEEALTCIRNALKKKMPWTEIEKLVQNPEPGIQALRHIKSLNLAKNSFDMELCDTIAHVSDNSESTALKDVLTIDIDLSSFANARKYHDKRKTAATKEEKTIRSSTKALKSAHVKTQTALKEVAVKTSIQRSRKVYWFEKFFWCISSENYLMIAGRDAQQNELVVKRYMKAGDVYVHGDLHGAASVVVKNNDPGRDVPPRTLEEAATMAVCHSAAWEAKIVARSWWVRPHQVSKTAPSGEYLSVGAFMIRGKKNYLPLTQLVLGFGFLFKLDDESLARHSNDRSGKQVVHETELESAEVDVPVSGEDDDDADVSDKDGDSGTQFPDTKVNTMIGNIGENEIEEDVTIVSSAEPRVKTQVMRLTKKTMKKGSKSQRQHVLTPANNLIASESLSTINSSKEMSRSQRAKQKKIKKKYKDQDEEDRMIRMAILGKIPAPDHPHGDKKKNRRANKVLELSNAIRDVQNRSAGAEKDKIRDELVVMDGDTNTGNVPIDSATEAVVIGEVVPSEADAETTDLEVKREEESDQELDSDSDGEKSGSSASIAPHIRLLNSLTGQPTSEDNLLFCVPVVGPYSCLTSYKFKVKVTPGNSRRGKAAKTALHLFTMDRNITQREKDLLKNAKDMDISKNMPAKVKIATSANALQKRR